MRVVRKKRANNGEKVPTDDAGRPIQETVADDVFVEFETWTETVRVGNGWKEAAARILVPAVINPRVGDVTRFADDESYTVVSCRDSQGSSGAPSHTLCTLVAIAHGS